MSAGLSRAEIAELCGCRPEEIPRAPRYSLLKFQSPGPVATRYLQSTGPIDLITGPAGSGKTVATVFKVLRFSVHTMPVCRDGRLRVRGTVMRDNFRALYRTTLRSWFEFFPPDYGGAIFTGGQDRPAQHVLKLSTGRDGREVPVDLTVDFFAVGDVAIEELLKGYETSWGWCNEVDLLHPRVPPFLYGRTGRFPKLEDLPAGATRPRMVAADMNPPDVDHPVWQAGQAGSFNPPREGDVAANPARTVHFFQQPSGLSLEAENRLGKSYAAYEEESRTMTAEDVRRFVHGQPGYALDGKPVYLEFDAARHVAPGPVPVLPGVPIDIGFDQGLSPGAVLSQTASTGQVRLLDELVPDHGTGAARFLDQLLTILRGRFPGMPLGILGADPAGFYGADRDAGELSWAEMVGAGLGRMLQPAPSNEPAIRIEAVKMLLRTAIDATTPALLIDPRCKTVIGGFAAHYKYRRIRTAGASDRYEDRPYKNHYATAHDALQYGVLTRRGRAGVISDAAKAGRPGNVVPMVRPVLERPGEFSIWDVGR